MSGTREQREDGEPGDQQREQREGHDPETDPEHARDLEPAFGSGLICLDVSSTPLTNRRGRCDRAGLAVARQRGERLRVRVELVEPQARGPFRLAVVLEQLVGGLVAEARTRRSRAWGVSWPRMSSIAAQRSSSVPATQSRQLANCAVELRHHRADSSVSAAPPSPDSPLSPQPASRTRPAIRANAACPARFAVISALAAPPVARAPAPPASPRTPSRRRLARQPRSPRRNCRAPGVAPTTSQSVGPVSSSGPFPHSTR